jgi:hypothetical protein
MFLSEKPFVKSYNNTELTEWSTFMKASQIWDKIEEYVAETGEA